MTRSKIAPENTTVAQLQERQAKDRGEHEFLVFEDVYSHGTRHSTYREFDVLVNKHANVLAARKTGEKSQVALYLDNCIELMECALTLVKMGAVLVPVDATLAPFELGCILGLCQVQTLITYTKNLDEVCPSVPDTVKDIIAVIEGGNEDEGAFSDLPRLHELTRHETNTFTSNPRIQPQDVCEILFTSGMTSVPKGVMITYMNFAFSGDFVSWELSMNSEDRYMISMVATRVNYQLSVLAPVLTLRATLTMFSRYRVSCFWRQVRLHRATFVQEMAMIMVTTLCQPVDLEERDHRVRKMHYFLPLSTRDKETFEECFGVLLLNNYGLTECLIGAIINFPHGERRWPSIGKVGPSYKVRIVDDEGPDLSEGEMGELVPHDVPGASPTVGYWDNLEATAEVLDEDGWYYTHDYAYVEDGWVYSVDRRVDLVKHSGESVSPVEVEGVIEDLLGVREVAVIGALDGVRGQAVKTFIVAEANAAPGVEAVIDHCAGRLVAFEVPSFVEFVEELPRGNYGKVQKYILANS